MCKKSYSNFYQPDNNESNCWKFLETLKPGKQLLPRESDFSFCKQFPLSNELREISLPLMLLSGKELRHASKTSEGIADSKLSDSVQ